MTMSTKPNYRKSNYRILGVRQVLVEKLKWMTSTVFLELMALCQVMPGPTSTQMSFAIGITQQGVTGGLLSGKSSSSWGAVVGQGRRGGGGGGVIRQIKRWGR